MKEIRNESSCPAGSNCDPSEKSKEKCKCKQNK